MPTRFWPQMTIHPCVVTGARSPVGAFLPRFHSPSSGATCGRCSRRAGARSRSCCPRAWDHDGRARCCRTRAREGSGRERGGASSWRRGGAPSIPSDRRWRRDRTPRSEQGDVRALPSRTSSHEEERFRSQARGGRRTRLARCPGRSGRRAAEPSPRCGRIESEPGARSRRGRHPLAPLRDRDPQGESVPGEPSTEMVRAYAPRMGMMLRSALQSWLLSHRRS